MLRKTTVPGLVKDTRTNLVINTNTKEYEDIVAQRKRKHETDMLWNELRTLSTTVKALQNEIVELRNMIKGNSREQ